MGVDLGIWKYRKDLEPDQRTKRKAGKTMKSVTFYTWDFGGQEEYYVTHQCFLSTRSLYLVVWDVEEGEEGIDQLGPWLHNIQVRPIRKRVGQSVDGALSLSLSTSGPSPRVTGGGSWDPRGQTEGGGEGEEEDGAVKPHQGQISGELQLKCPSTCL